MKKLGSLVLFFLVLISLSCKEKPKQLDDNESHFDLSVIIDQLLRFRFEEVALLQIETMPIYQDSYWYNDSLEEIPPPPLTINYSRSFFYTMYEQNLIDSLEAHYMYNEIKGKNIIRLDTTIIDIACISQFELDSLFEKQDISDSYDSIEKKYGASRFLKVSTPIFNENKDKLLISIDYYCGPLCGQGYVLLLEKKNGDWAVIKEWGTWES